MHLWNVQAETGMACQKSLVFRHSLQATRTPYSLPRHKAHSLKQTKKKSTYAHTVWQEFLRCAGGEGSGRAFSKMTEKHFLLQRRNLHERGLNLLLLLLLGLKTKYLFLEQRRVLRGEVVNTFGFRLKVIKMCAGCPKGGGRP